MRTFATAAFLAAFGLTAAGLTVAGLTAAGLTAAGLTAAEAQPDAAAPQGSTGPVCLHPFDSPADAIDHTHVVDPTTILFYMRNGTIWKNTLAQPCRGLMLHGFNFTTPEDELCSNRQGIEVLETHQVCVLGMFTRYVPPVVQTP